MSQQANQFNFFLFKDNGQKAKRNEEEKNVERKAVLEGKKGNFIF